MEREEKPKDESEKKVPNYKFPMKLGRYTLLKIIGIGGMGEVFLAHDPICGRKVALKRIVRDRKSQEKARLRFKKEARITAQLSHPSIIPIYDLYEDKEDLYYTMPFLEGETLHAILVKTRLATQHGLPPNVMGASIPALMLAFLNICQAVEHTHSKGFIHRDLKAGNIIVGSYNEVTILDWGVATEIYHPEEESKEEYDEVVDIKTDTNPRGIVGTMEYMAPERAFRQPASIQSDIYSLGVILHFMLTLHLPYKRPTTASEWRTQLEKHGAEPPIDPQDAAPYREITQQLSRITLKCLHPNPDKRFASVRDIITEVKRYIEGRPDWIPSQKFDLNNNDDWEFQESVMLTKQMAISRYAGVTEWVLLMLSKESYSGNIQVQTMIRIQEEGEGIGFLMCVPENSKRECLEKGYLLWIGSKEHPGAKLFRDNVEVCRVDGVFLTANEIYNIAVERQDSTIRLLINDVPKMTYQSHVPIVGGHFGIVVKDTEFEVSPVVLSTGSQNVLINCLSIPDAFLLNKDYDRALMEYRRIANSFKGRPEGREAIFRAGYTLIEQGKDQKSKAKEYFSKALDEFELLHKGPGAPIEYLGKSLVYQAENNLEEEIKCLELGIRKFSKHPLRHALDEHILFRLHETAQKDRIGAYAFTLLTLRHVPRIYNIAETDRLTKNLTFSWEDLPFIKTPASYSSESEEHLELSIVLSFWLARPNSLYELIHDIPTRHRHRHTLLENGLLALLQTGYPKLIDFILNVKYQKEETPEFLLTKSLFKIAIDDIPIHKKLELLLPKATEPLLYSVFDQGLTLKEVPKLLPVNAYFEKTPSFDPLHIWALLLAGKKREPAKLLEGKPTHDTSSIYFTLQGCYLAATKGESAALAHFDPLIETTFPRTPLLLGHFLKGHIALEGPWFSQAFLWEKLQLYKQLTLYHHCLSKNRNAAHYEKLAQEELTKSQIPLNFI